MYHIGFLFILLRNSWQKLSLYCSGRAGLGFDFLREILMRALSSIIPNVCWLPSSWAQVRSPWHLVAHTSTKSGHQEGVCFSQIAESGLKEGRARFQYDHRTTIAFGAKKRRHVALCIRTFTQRHSTDESEQGDSQLDHSNSFEASDHFKRRDCGVVRRSIIVGKHARRSHRFVLRRSAKRLTR
jgi:hypothetical protein